MKSWNIQKKWVQWLKKDLSPDVFDYEIRREDEQNVTDDGVNQTEQDVPDPAAGQAVFAGEG